MDKGYCSDKLKAEPIIDGDAIMGYNKNPLRLRENIQKLEYHTGTYF